MRNLILILVLLCATPAVAQDAPQGSERGEKAALVWLPWSDAVFARARREHRFVLLDLEAVWCHWCHVMDQTTYRDAEVIRHLQAHYLTVRTDQDARPDLSNRYEDYGWPATIVFDGEGHEIIRRQGYIPPAEMARVLQSIVDDPSPGPSVEPEPDLKFSESPLLSKDLLSALARDYRAGFDTKQGSWGLSHKYLDWDSVEYSMDLAARGHVEGERMARRTLDAGLNLLDPAWGGVYQYSTGGVWTEPHFEKIMSVQAENLRIYALAYAQWKDPSYLNAAQSIRSFLQRFLTSPEGAFYTSQDADLVAGRHSADYFRLSDAARRELGVPRVDRHIYARENGRAIAALATLYGATGDEQTLRQAMRAAEWVIRNRALGQGGFRHNSHDPAGPFLGDTLAMARAFLSLYAATGDRQWLVLAESSMQFIDSRFRDELGAGYATAVTPAGGGYRPHPQRDENVAVVRVANLLFHCTANPAYRRMSETALRFLGAPAVAHRAPAASVLLANFEAASPPLHITVVGHKDDPAARALFLAALKYPSSYKRLEWWDTREGRLPNPDVQYPEGPSAAAFVCTDRTCSPPIREAAEVWAKVNKLSSLQTQVREER